MHSVSSSKTASPAAFRQSDGAVDNMRKSQLGWVGALVLVTIAVFWGTLDNGFVSWDDRNYFLNNPYVKGLSAGNLREIFGSFRNGNYHPLPLLAYAIEYVCYGFAPRGYHAVNLAWHAANVVLLFFLLRALRLNAAAAFAACLLFAVHPLRVEAVAWVTGRKDLMCTFFSLGAILVYLLRARSGRPGFSWGVLGLFLLALLSKGTAMVVPLVLLVVDNLCGRPLDREGLKEKWPYLALALLFVLIAVVARASFQGVLDEGGYGAVAMLAIGIYRLVFYYVARTLIPLAHLVSPYPPETNFYNPWVLAATVICLAIAALVWWRRWYCSRLAMGLWIFLVAISPALCLPVVGYSADRFAYFPSIGLAFCAGVGVERIARAWTASGTRILGAASLFVLAGVLAWLTIGRCEAWRDSVSLFSDAIALFDGRTGQETNLSRAYTDRGNAYREENQLDSAVADFTQATRINPQASRPWLLLGETHLAMGQLVASAEGYGRAVQVAPELAAGWTGRSVALRKLGELPQSLAAAGEAVRLSPDDPAVYNTRGRVWKEMDRPEEALQDFNRVVELAPQRVEGYLNRGMVLRTLGRKDLADRDFLFVLQLDPENRIAKKWLGSAPGAGPDY